MVRTPTRPRGAVPEVLEGLLAGLSQKYQDIPDDGALLSAITNRVTLTWIDRRKAWLYEVPLIETHVLRNSINDVRLTSEQIAEIAKRFNAPVIASAVKLWLLELSPPVMGWEGWEDAKGVYPASELCSSTLERKLTFTVGADLERDASSAVTSVLGRLPGSHLFVLDALIGHFRRCVTASR
jgi:hypothetical protein